MVGPCSSLKEQTLKLIKEKDHLEKLIADYGLILETNNNVGMHGNLIDSEGFPRNDIDVHQVRHARNQIICIQNDLKTLMTEIEKGLHAVHAEAAADSRAGLSTKTAGLNLNDEHDSDSPTLQAFVKVAEVWPGSPAEDAGLKANDEILAFGSINFNNFHNDLQKIKRVVKVNQRTQIKLSRAGQQLEMSLTPRTWSGRGLLGCHIVPIDSDEEEMDTR